MSPDEITERAISARRKSRLEWYEAEIEKRGKALSSIFAEMANDPLKPWFETHITFELYCEERWQVSPRRIQQIKKGESLKALLASEAPELAPVVKTMPEGQLRELAKAPPEQRVEVLRVAVKSVRNVMNITGDKKLTAGTIKRAKARVVSTTTNLPMHFPATGGTEKPEKRTETELYHELLYAVGRKWPNETRHETALRYILETEEQSIGRGLEAYPKNAADR